MCCRCFESIDLKVKRVSKQGEKELSHIHQDKECHGNDHHSHCVELEKNLSELDHREVCHDTMNNLLLKRQSSKQLCSESAQVMLLSMSFMLHIVIISHPTYGLVLS
jgi:hypothetical protein